MPAPAFDVAVTGCDTCTTMATCDRDGSEALCRECEHGTISQNNVCSCAIEEQKISWCMLHPSDCDVCHLETYDSVDQSLHQEATTAANAARQARQEEVAAGAQHQESSDALDAAYRAMQDARTAYHDAQTRKSDAFNELQSATRAESDAHSAVQTSTAAHTRAEQLKAQHLADWEDARSNARELEQVARNAADAAIRHAREVHSGSESAGEQAERLADLLEVHAETQLEERNAAHAEYQAAEEHAQQEEQKFEDLRAALADLQIRLEQAEAEATRARQDAEEARARHERETDEYNDAQAELERARTAATDAGSFEDVSGSHQETIEESHNEGAGFGVLDEYRKQSVPCSGGNPIEDEEHCSKASHAVLPEEDLGVYVLNGVWPEMPAGCSVQFVNGSEIPRWNDDPVGCGSNCSSDVEYICQNE